MNRIEYMTALDRSLTGLPEQERRDALEFYLNYFADASEGGKTEEQVIEELGSPTHVAAKIISESNFKAKSAASQQAFKKAGDKKSIFHGVKGILLAIAAIIIAMPGAFIAGAIIISLLIAALSVLLSLGIVALVVPLSLAAAGIAAFVATPAYGIGALGVGFMLIGGALLAGTCLYALVVLLVRGISALCTWILKKVEASKAKRGAAQ